MAIASPSAPSFCCTSRSGSTHRRFAQSISRRTGSNPKSRVTARFNASSDGEVVYELNYNSHRRGRGAFPVYVTLPLDAVGPTAQTMRRKRAMAQSFRALAAAGVEGLVMEVWWGLVEREIPRRYNWQGYLEIVEMAKRFGLKVRAVMAFHQCGLGPDDPFWIPLPVWVLEEMDKDPNMSNADEFGRTNMEYISLGCDILPILHGRSPIQAYADLMRNFRDTFRSFLGGVITVKLASELQEASVILFLLACLPQRGIQVGLGPGGELRYPSSPTQKLTWARRSSELGEFQCYDKYMLSSLNASTHEMSLMQNPDSTNFFLRWYSKMLLLHGERICREAETIFRGNKVNMSGKVAGAHWLYDTAIRDGLVPVIRMFGRYGFTVCCTCFEMQDDEMNRDGRPESLLKQLVLAVRICDVPLEGENYSTDLDDNSFGQILKMSKLYSDGLEMPSFSFNFVRMDKNLFEPRNWVSFTRFMRRVSEMNVFRAGVDFEGGNGGSSPSVAAFAGAVLAY